jgi:hypothetical protein
MAEAIETQTNSQISITLSILENKCESFTFTPYALSLKAPLGKDEYEFNFTINLNLIQASQHARVSTIVKLLEKKANDSRMELAELRSTHLFWIQNFKEIIFTNSQGQMVIPNPLMEVCNSISISSIRGMFSVKTENTLFDNLILPLMNPKSLIPQVPPIH